MALTCDQVTVKRLQSCIFPAMPIAAQVVASIAGIWLFPVTSLAADAVVAAEPDSMDYVRVCDAFGEGYFYIPGSETCLKFGGYLRVEFSGGDPNGQDTFPGGGGDSWYSRSRLNFRVSTATDTDYGALKTYAELEFQRDNNTENEARLEIGTIELAGFLVGYVDTLYTDFTDDAGNTINDYYDVNYGDFHQTQIRYTYEPGNGFVAAVSIEDDSDISSDTVTDYTVADDDYMPDVIAAVGYVTDPFKVRLVGAYDESMEEGAIKLRLDGTIGDLSVFAMGGWNTDGDSVNNYAQWDGDWAAWIGASYVLTEKATINASMNFDDGGDIEGALNVAYAVAPGFEIIPELDFRNKMDEKEGPDAKDWGGVVRFQRNF